MKNSGRRKSTNVQDIRDPAAAAARNVALDADIMREGAKTAARSMLQSMKQGNELGAVAAHQAREGRTIQQNVRSRYDGLPDGGLFKN